MKKIIFLFVIIISIYFNFTTVRAEEYGDFDGAIEDILEVIDEADFEEITKILNENLSSSKTLKEWIILFLTGDGGLDISLILSLFNLSFQGVISSVGRLLIYVLFIGILCGIVNIINSKNNDNNEQNIINFILYCLVVTLSSQIISTVFSSTRESIENMTKTVDGCFPLLITLSEFSGGFGTALFKPITAVVSLISGVLCKEIFLPILSTTAICVIVGNISTTIKLDALKKSLLSLVKWILGIVTIVFTIVITAQGIVNMQYNGMSFKILKYATGSIIPIVGGFISGGLDVLLSSAVLVKNSFGLIIVFYVFFKVISTGATILIVSFLLKFAVSVAEPLLDGRVVKLLTGIGEVFSYLTAVIILCGFSYVLVCFTIINSTALII